MLNEIPMSQLPFDVQLAVEQVEDTDSNPEEILVTLQTRVDRERLLDWIEANPVMAKALAARNLRPRS